MILDIRKIGNAKGVIIPKNILLQCGFGEKVSTEVVDNQLILKKAGHPREGWDCAFEDASVENVLTEGIANQFDDEEWTW